MCALLEIVNGMSGGLSFNQKHDCWERAIETCVVCQ